MSLETKVVKNGALAETAPLFEKFDTSAELTNARHEDESLRSQYFYTSNFAMYTVENGEEFIYFGGREANPILNNLEEACNQLITDQNYTPSNEERQAVFNSVSSGSTLKMKLSDLKLERGDDEHSHFVIDTKNYDTLNATQRAFAEKVYGEGEDFEKNMEMLNKAGIEKTRIYVLNQDYVKKNVREGEAVARACWLYIFNYSSDFDAYDRNVGNSNALRGVRLVGGADVQKKKLVTLPEDEMYDILTQYLGPKSLGLLKKELTKIYHK